MKLLALLVKEPTVSFTKLNVKKLEDGCVKTYLGSIEWFHKFLRLEQKVTDEQLKVMSLLAEQIKAWETRFLRKVLHLNRRPDEGRASHMQRTGIRIATILRKLD